MAYTDTDFPTKKALKAAVSEGRKVSVFQPGGMFPGPKPGTAGVVIEGPQYPKPHRWYAQVDLDSEGYITKVK